MNFWRLHHDKLYAKRKNYKFTKQEVEYLGHMVKDVHVLIDPTSVKLGLVLASSNLCDKHTTVSWSS